MKYKIGALVASLVCSISIQPLQKLDELQKRLEAMKPQLEAAIKKLEDGKSTMAKVYQDKLKPQLLDKLDQSRDKVKASMDKLKGPIDMLEKIPGRYQAAGVDVRGIITGTFDLADLYPTLTWIRGQPLGTIDEHLKTVKDDFVRVTNKLRLEPISSTGCPQGGIPFKLTYPSMVDPTRIVSQDVCVFDPDAKKLFDHFDNAIEKLKSAVEWVDTMIEALKG